MADHPITISNGSPLILEHDSWDWDPQRHRRVGTAVHDAVTSVSVTSNGRDFGSIPFTNEPLSIHLTYVKTSGGTIGLSLVTLPNGTHPVLTVEIVSGGRLWPQRPPVREQRARCHHGPDDQEGRSRRDSSRALSRCHQNRHQL